MSSNQIFCRLIQPTIQIHPTLSCNLHCKHCYSDSGPSVKLKLDVEIINKAISDSAEMGYKIVSISGGEPLIYNGLESVLLHAKSCGMKTKVTTNETLLKTEKTTRLKECLDIMSISLDGPPEFHNQMRKSKTAFDLLCKSIHAIKKTNTNFGFVHTLTKKSWEHLSWIANFSSISGSSLLQIHPLEMFGRARNMDPLWPNDEILARVYLLTLVLTEKYPHMKIQFDAFHQDHIRENPELVYASNLSQFDTDPVNLLSDIVIEADGTVVPISYGVSKRFQICNIKEKSLLSGWKEFIANGTYLAFRNLCKRIFDDVSKPRDLPFFNWYEMLVSYSHLQQFDEYKISSKLQS